VNTVISMLVKYRIMAVMMVETGIISSIAASLIGQAVILVIMFVEVFKTDVIFFISKVIMGLMSHRRIIFSISQCIDIENINW